MEKYLVHGPGDFLGQPFRLRQDQKAFIYRCYELRADGSRRWRRAVRGRPKGDGKTELSAAFALAEFAGPAAFAGWTPTGQARGKCRISPDIPVAAASYEQADLLYAAAATMVKEGPLAEYIDAFDTEMQFKDGSVGALYRVAAVAGTNDGKRPTFAACDETHEWTGNKKRVHLVIKGGVYKRTDAWILEITTAGRRGDGSVAEDAYDLKLMIEGGHNPADDTLIDWSEASGEWDLEDPEQLLSAIYEANEAADVLFPAQNLVDRYHDPATPHHEFRRYNLNQWPESTGESWLDDYPGIWAECAGTVEFDAEVVGEHAAVMGIDFALKRDGVAVVTAQLMPDGSIPVFARVWKLDGVRIDVAEALSYIRAVVGALPVRGIVYDPKYFEFPAQVLEDEGFPMIEFPQSGERMVPACGNAMELIRARRVVHNGDPVLSEHVKRSVWREAEGGFRLSKTRSKDRIDACIAMVMALQLAVTPGALTPADPATAKVDHQQSDNFFRPKERLNI